MQSEREQQARQYRGEGAEAAQTVRANAERERTVILAEAQRDAQRLRGEGDAQAVRIYADSFGQDQEFFAFYRSLQAYREALNGRDTSFVMTPEGNFFRFFGGWPGARGTPAPAASLPGGTSPVGSAPGGTPPAPGQSSANPPAAAPAAASPAAETGGARPQ